MKVYGDERVIDENASLCDMQAACSQFFDNPSGKRETYSIHRGFLIVRATDVHACGGPVRRTSVFMFLPEGYGDESPRPDLFCVSACTNLGSVAQAKRYVDNLLEHGNYEYGWQNNEVEA